MAEQRTHNSLVVGSSPTPRTILFLFDRKVFMMYNYDYDLDENYECIHKINHKPKQKDYQKKKKKNDYRKEAKFKKDNLERFENE